MSSGTLPLNLGGFDFANLTCHVVEISYIRSMLHVPNQQGCHERGDRMHLCSRYLINSMLGYKMRLGTYTTICQKLYKVAFEF